MITMRNPKYSLRVCEGRLVGWELSFCDRNEFVEKLGVEHGVRKRSSDDEHELKWGECEDEADEMKQEVDSKHRMWLSSDQWF